MSLEERTILIVEDNEDDAELALLALRDAGIRERIDLVRDGDAALEYLLGSQARTTPILVLLDIKIPGVDGFEVLETVRAADRTRGLVVVILSSSDVPEDVARAYELGANSYVCKPVESRMYSETMGRVVRYWVEINRVPTRRTLDGGRSPREE